MVFSSESTLTKLVNQASEAIFRWRIDESSGAVDFNGLSFKIESPLNSEITSIEGLVTSILNILITIAVPVIVMAIIYAGFLYVTARGNTAQVSKATAALTYAVIGAILILGAVAFSEIISATVASFRSE